MKTEMLISILEKGKLQIIKNKLKRKYPSSEIEDIEDAISDAIEALIKSNKIVFINAICIINWLLKVADRKLYSLLKCKSCFISFSLFAEEAVDCCLIDSSFIFGDTEQDAYNLKCFDLFLYKLEAKYRLIIELKFQGKTFNEIASIMNLSENTIKKDYYHTIKIYHTIQQQHSSALVQKAS